MMLQRRFLILTIGLALLAGLALLITRNINSPTSHKTTAGEYLYDANHVTFSHPAPALNAKQRQIFNLGNRIFNTNWTAASDAKTGFDGLGPLYNRASCAACHMRDGRGQPPNDATKSSAQPPLSMLIRISIAGNVVHGAPKPVPGYGLQINDQALPGLTPEASVALTWHELPGTYGDGENFSLRAPTIKLRKSGYGTLPANILTSARVAPAVFGLGLIEALSDASILALVDPNDVNKDGISGRANTVYSRQMRAMALGRYGWKANVATLTDQTQDAALFDIGLSSAHYPQQNCEPEQIACRRAKTGSGPELSRAFTEKLTRYVQMLGVPKPRPATLESTRGEALFRDFQCAACHIVSSTTSTHSSLSYLRNQVFQPYTDLLLHDMGEGLSDHRPDFAASGAEWRTAPLWGIGLIPDINGHSFYLHDGRARGIAEAFLWHGGEAQSAKERFRNASSADRKALIAFVNRL